MVFLFNGPDMGFVSKNDLQYWYIEHELNESLVLNSLYIDKGYAFFRYLMDSGYDDDDIIKVLKLMLDNNITDSRDIPDDLWNTYLQSGGNEEIKEKLHESGDMIHIPDVLEKLAEYNIDLDLVGGAANECLREVEIILKLQNKKYNRLDNWIYYTSTQD